MKKLISCLLAVLLVCSLMSMNVFAAEVPGWNQAIGTRPQDGSGDVEAGVNEDNFPGNINNGSADVTVNFGQTITDSEGNEIPVPGGDGTIIVHKYAVDITYGNMLLDLTTLNLGDTDNGRLDDATEQKQYYMVWDVNTYKYVLCTTSDGGATYQKVTQIPTVDLDGNDETTEDVVSVLETPVELDGTVKITNHSDLSVYTTLTLAEADGYNDIDWKITAKKDATETPVNGYTHSEEITKATAATANTDKTTVTDGSATDGSEYYFTATPAVTDGWLGVIGNLINTTTTTIGTITVTISNTNA